MSKGEVLALIVAFMSTAIVAADDAVCNGLPADQVVALPYWGDCNHYWECFNGQATLHTCEDGLWFNEATSSCDFPSAGGCSRTTNEPPPTGDPRCVPGKIDYFPDPEDCAKYVECYHGNTYLMECPPGYWFNAQLKHCTLPEDSGCKVSTLPPWTTPDPLCHGVRPGETKLIRYEGDCRKYWECDGADLYLRQCAPGLFFDEGRQLCDWPELVDCDDSTRTPDPSTSTPPTTDTTPINDEDPRCIDGSTSYWPHPAECHKYIECYKGGSYEMNCPSGLYFDDPSKKCVDPSQTDCGRTDPPTRPTETTNTGWTADPDCPWPSNDRYLYPYPGDCTKFYECVNGRKEVAVCPPGLYFNPHLLVCDYPYQADCEWARFWDFLRFW